MKTTTSSRRELIKLGYSKEDACDYCVAACWEFIIPSVGADIPNIDALSFVACVNDVVKYDLKTAKTTRNSSRRQKSGSQTKRAITAAATT